MNFQRSAAMSIGIELELQLVRPHDLDLSRDAADLLARLARRSANCVARGPASSSTATAASTTSASSRPNEG